ncbi:MAG: hypothetical protein WC329_06640 [Candidatus Omnitrophota bacterium]|jgi:type II secretory pathway component PulC
MENKNLTPEERLLKIIENPGNQASGAVRRPLVGAGGKENADSAAFRFPQFPAGGFTLRTAVQLSVVSAVLVTLFLLYDYVSVSSDSSVRLKKALSRGTADVHPVAAAEKAPAFKDLLGSAGKHNIFSVEPAKAENLLSAETAQAVSTLKLVGILWSEKPQAMVEDTKNAKTYLLNDGDSVNDLKVRKIYADKVVLSKDGREWELR